MIEQPTIRTADTDGNGIVKRRRRPALSCVECRVRKVKCDRRRPCGACTKINSTTCTYRPHPPGIRSQSEQPLRDDTSADYAKDSESWSSARSSPQAVAPPTEFDALINRYVAPGVFGEHDKLKLLPADRPCFNLSTHSDRTQDSTISALLGRIHSLEKKLASTLNNQAGYPTSVGESPRWRNGQSAEPEPHGQSYDIRAINSHDAPGATHTAAGYDTQRKEVNKPTELHSTVSEIKRITKRTRIPQSSISSELRSCIPPKELCDKLVDCYLRTFEGVFRVLHVPSFKKAYHSHWLGTAPDKPSFIHTLLLVCAIAVPFYVGPEKAKLCQSARKWLQAAVDWQGAPHAESRLNMVGLQIQILILIARQVCNVDGDYSWIPAGTLLRTAMHLGLHRDPSHFPKITVYHGEMRRRLWATVLEIAAQSSLDMGMPPMISVNDYDTKPPSNINDEDMGDGMDTPLGIKPATTYTDSSIQIAFTQTLPTRLEIIRLINNLRFDLPYDDILCIGTKLLDTCYEKTIFFKSALDSGCNITPFQIKMLDTLVRRFILCLHRPYFSKANKNPRYHYSRKICLDTSLAICAPATELVPGEEDDWTRMSHRCVGIFKTFFLYSLSTIYYELISQINESQKEASLFTPLISTSARATTSSPQRLQSLPAQYHLLREILESAQVTALTRIRNGEKNAKGIFFLKCALARIDALVSGANPEAAVLDAAKNSAIVVSKVLAAVYREEHGEDIDLSATSSGLNKEKDDYQVNNSLSNTASHNDSRMAVGNSNADAQPGFEDPFSIFDSTIEGLDTMLSAPDLSDLGAGMDIDLNACMQGQAMDTGNNMLHFGRSPEWFYNVDRWAAAGNFGNVGGFGYEV